MKHVHLIGIGGTGLSAIARVLLERGYAVSGSDRVASPLFLAITAAGARTFLGHAAEQIAGADLVIQSSAIPDDNPEVIAAKAQGIPVLKRSEFLDEITQDKDTLAVAGSHGKTTTTAMLIWILEQLGVDPTFIVGSVINQLGCNARSGTGLYFAIEADEYDNMFLGLSPKIAVITNIEHDHPDCFPTKQEYRDAFMKFVQRVRPGGCILLCHDDPEALSLAEDMTNSEICLKTYGESAGSDYRVFILNLEGGSPYFNLLYRKNENEIENLGEVTLKLAGHHNALNATAALAVIHQLGLPMNEAIAALGEFIGTERRFQVLGVKNGITVIDDYGHHPTEIAATLEAARSSYPDNRIWAVWQPHTYTRTKTLENEFVKALNLADQVLVLKIYAAREQDPGYSAETIANTLPEGKANYIEDFSEAAQFLTGALSPGDVAIFFSAGDATEVSQAVIDQLDHQTTSEMRKG
jgi:UDP-N-acetylmuramate--alanine ligase